MKRGWTNISLLLTEHFVAPQKLYSTLVGVTWLITSWKKAKGQKGLGVTDENQPCDSHSCRELRCRTQTAASSPSLLQRHLAQAHTLNLDPQVRPDTCNWVCRDDMQASGRTGWTLWGSTPGGPSVCWDAHVVKTLVWKLCPHPGRRAMLLGDTWWRI